MTHYHTSDGTCMEASHLRPSAGCPKLSLLTEPDNLSPYTEPFISRFLHRNPALQPRQRIITSSFPNRALRAYSSPSSEYSSLAPSTELSHLGSSTQSLNVSHYTEPSHLDPSTEPSHLITGPAAKHKRRSPTSIASHQDEKRDAAFYVAHSPHKYMTVETIRLGFWTTSKDMDQLWETAKAEMQARNSLFLKKSKVVA